MTTALLIAQLLLAAMFLSTGLMKATLPVARFATSLPWSEDYPVPVVRLLGATQILAALGLTLPLVTTAPDLLAAAAATGLALTMALAIVVHARRGEHRDIVLNAALLALAALVAWGRLAGA
ncbi:DoxX family protein [Oerskovia turbata]